MAANLACVPAEVLCLLRGSGRRTRRQEGVERSLAVDHDRPATGHRHDDVGTGDPRPGDRGHLLLEGAMPSEPRELQASAQLHLAPVAPDLWTAQCVTERLGLGPELIPAEPDRIDLLAKLCLPRLSMQLQ